MLMIWRRLKFQWAVWWDRRHESWCWAHLVMWATGDIRWSDIDRDCRDAETSRQAYCWCGKRCHRSQPPQGATHEHR